MSSLWANSPETQKTHKTLEVTQPADWTRVEAATVWKGGVALVEVEVKPKTKKKKTYIGNREMQRLVAILCDNRWIAAKASNFLCESKAERKKIKRKYGRKKVRHNEAWGEDGIRGSQKQQ